MMKKKSIMSDTTSSTEKKPSDEMLKASDALKQAHQNYKKELDLIIVTKQQRTLAATCRSELFHRDHPWMKNEVSDEWDQQIFSF